MMMSPRPAVRRLYREALPPRTLKHMTSLAPVLSATSSRVCIWIMGTPGRLQGARDAPVRRSSLVRLPHPTRDSLLRGGGLLALAGQCLLGAGADDPDDA